MKVGIKKVIKQSVEDGHLSKVDVANAAIEMLPEKGTQQGIKKEQKDAFVKTMDAVAKDPNIKISDAARKGLKAIASELSYDRHAKAYAVGLDATQVLSILDVRAGAKGLSTKATRLVEEAKQRKDDLRATASELREEIGALESE